MGDILIVFFCSFGGIVITIDILLLIISVFVAATNENGKNIFRGVINLIILIDGVFVLVFIIALFIDYYKVSYYPQKNEVCFHYLLRKVCVHPSDILKSKIYYHRYRRARTPGSGGTFDFVVMIKKGNKSKRLSAFSLMVSHKALRRMRDFLNEIRKHSEHFKKPTKMLITDFKTM